MGCVCGKPSSIEDSGESPSRRPPAPRPVAAASLQAPAPSKRPAAVVAVPSLRREAAADAAFGYRADAEKKHQSGPIRVGVQEVDRRRERHPGHPPMRVPSGVPKVAEGEQVAAGWPAWLASVAGEAIRGWVPRRADSFEKLDKIGQGTYSNVYRARDLDNNKVVALKKVRFDNMEPESVKFMAREILILRRLDHPNIIKLEGLVTSRMSCSLYLVFEYMEHDLAGLASFPGQKFHEPQVKCYMQQLLRGLDHCHSRGILHRDIKGSNLLIDNSGILKIADFGLASFFDPDQRIPLTSRVVTLWYRPPELLLGATNYGVAVDLWSTGCILAELYAGKPILPGRTEVEQLHKIFKLCGSPSEDYWRKSKLPHVTIFKPQQPYRRCVAETFKDFPPSALALVEILLSVDPADRGTAASALKNEFFSTKPFACDPSSLPKYPPSKEFDAKRRDEEIRRQCTSGNKVQRVDLERRGQKESRAIPAPEANAELISSMHKRQDQANSKSRSEKFNPHLEDLTSGFPIEPSRVTPVLESTEDSNNYYSHRASHSGPLVRRSQLPKVRKEEDVPKASAVSNSSAFSGVLATRRKVLTDDDSETFVAQIESGPSAGRLSESRNESSEVRKHDQAFRHRDDERSSNVDQQAQQGYGLKGNKINYSGPLLRPSGNVDQMLKEHDQQIQEVFRRAWHDKSKGRKVHGNGIQLGSKPNSFGVIPVYPSSRGSSISVFTSNRGSVQ